MLKITQDGGENSVALKLEGRVEGPWVDVLRSAWVEVKERSDGRRILVDLGAVTSADTQGRALLIKMRQQGAGLTRLSGFMRHMLEPDHEQIGGNHSDRRKKGE